MCWARPLRVLSHLILRITGRGNTTTLFTNVEIKAQAEEGLIVLQLIGKQGFLND